MYELFANPCLTPWVSMWGSKLQGAQRKMMTGKLIELSRGCSFPLNVEGLGLRVLFEIPESLGSGS